MRVQPDRSRPHWPDRHALAVRYSRRRAQLLHRRAVLTLRHRRAVLRRRMSFIAEVRRLTKKPLSSAAQRSAELCSVARLAVAAGCAAATTEAFWRRNAGHFSPAAALLGLNEPCNDCALGV